MPILEANLRHGVSTGITYRVLVHGVVPFYEEQESRQWAFCNFAEWANLEVEEKALIVAQHRLARAVELHGQDAVAQAAHRAAEKK